MLTFIVNAAALAVRGFLIFKVFLWGFLVFLEFESTEIIMSSSVYVSQI